MQLLYSMMRPILFRLEPEYTHRFTLKMLRISHRYSLDVLLNRKVRDLSTNVMGMTFPNPVGLAAGLDKDGEYIDSLATMGFGFIEIGTVTPKPQGGNPRPRLFRFPEANALINRMGFNNNGVDYMIENLKRSRYRGILGINIGKNASTPLATAADDYLICMNKVYPFASYIVLNISSPNTQGLRNLQNEEALGDLLTKLRVRQLELADHTGRYVPLVLKIAPDLAIEEIEYIARLLKRHRIDGVTATNTTISRDGLMHLPGAEEKGGMSGEPLHSKSTLVIRELAKFLDGAIPIIGVGGIGRPSDAWEKIDAGASLVQLYSGLVFHGPGLVGSCVDALRPHLAKLEKARRIKHKEWLAQVEAEEEAARIAAEEEAARIAAEEAERAAALLHQRWEEAEKAEKRAQQGDENPEFPEELLAEHTPESFKQRPKTEADNEEK